MKVILYVVLIFHAIFHLLGFLKAFNLSKLEQLSISISRVNGVLWLLVSLLFTSVVFAMILHSNSWLYLIVPAIVLSQYLFFTTWHDSKYGTIINFILILLAITEWGKIDFQNEYKKAVAKELLICVSNPNDLLTENDLINLPMPVRKYLIYTGSVGMPKVGNFNVQFDGKIRKNNQSAWMPFSSEQYNFLNNSVRLFFMKATMMKLPLAGFHSFNNGNAFMDIRLFSLFRVQYMTGKEMGIAETVTFFNDMCCMAPATLIDKRIDWMKVEGDSVFAKFTNNNISISAVLVFNNEGQLVNFISNDRYAASFNGKMHKIKWSTPLKNYKVVDGFKLAGYAETIYSYPDSELVYGTFELKRIKYNCVHSFK